MSNDDMVPDASDVPDAPPEYNPVRGPAREYAPSQMASNDAGFLRTVGLIGVALFVMGLSVALLNMLGKPRLLTQSQGLVAMALGLLAMFVHAVRDADPQVRRLYGAFGALLVVVTAVLAAVPVSGQYGGLFFPTGAATGVFGLLFLLAAARHEDDAGTRDLIAYAVAAAGTLAVAATLLLALFAPRYLPGFGVLFGLMGLLYLVSTTTVWDSSTPRGLAVAGLLGVVAVLMVVYTLARSVVGGAVPFFMPAGVILLVLGTLFGLAALGLASDRPLVVLARRELSAYFYSPIAYVVLFGVAAAGWLNYYRYIDVLAQLTDRNGGVTEPILTNYLFSLVPVFVTLFVVPALTMRLLSEESRTGTLEVLLTAPVQEWTVVLSKFLAALAFYLILTLAQIVYLFALYVVTGSPFDYRPILSYLVALAATGAHFVAMGLFFSCVTRNQIIAAVLSFFGMVVLLMFWMLQELTAIGPLWRGILERVSFLNMWLESLAGRLPVRDVILQLSFAAFWLYLSVKILESRRWK